MRLLPDLLPVGTANQLRQRVCIVGQSKLCFCDDLWLELLRIYRVAANVVVCSFIQNPSGLRMRRKLGHIITQSIPNLLQTPFEKLENPIP